MEQLIERFERAGVRLVLSGHEHNFQHALCNDVHYVVTGGAGKLRADRPSDEGFDKAHTVSWAPFYHLLLVTIDGNEAVVSPVGALVDGKPGTVKRETPAEHTTTDPIRIFSLTK